MSRPRSVPGRLRSSGLACLLLTFLAYLAFSWALWRREAGQGEPMNWYASFVWSLPIVVSVLGLSGILRTRGGGLDRRPEPAPPVGELLVVVVPTVARPDTLVSLERVVRSLLRHLPRSFPRLRVDVVVEEGCGCADRVAALTSLGAVRVVTVRFGAPRTPVAATVKPSACRYWRSTE